MNTIPQIINNFNIYKDGNQLIGVSGEVTIPDFEGNAEAISGAGLLGEFEAVNPGQFSAQEFELPFRVLYGDVFTVFGSDPANLTLRGSLQISNGNGEKEYKQLRVIVQGSPKKLTGGTVSAGKTMSASVTLALTYIKIEIDGETSVELDKLNSVFVVGGVDKLAAIKALI